MPSKWEVNKAVRASELASPSKLIMLVLSDISDAGTAEVPERYTPSLTVLSRETGLGRSTVAEHLNALEAAGWVERVRPDVTAARLLGERTGYKLLIPPGAVRPTLGDDPVVPQADPAVREPDRVVREPDQPLVQEPDQVVQEPDHASPGAGLALVQEPDGGSPGAGHKNRSLPDQPDPSQPSTASATPPADKPKVIRGTRLPADFRATPEMIEWARQETPLVGAKETEAFIDYWKALPGQRGLKLDWQATWKNWMRRAQADKERFGSRGPAVRHQPYRNPADVSAYDKDLIT